MGGTNGLGLDERCGSLLGLLCEARQYCFVNSTNPEEMLPKPQESAPFYGIVGPTAVGKTELSLLLAERGDAEIISVDSMLVYRGMDIGTAKPSMLERERVTHHVIDCADPPERYDARRYLEDVERAQAGIETRGKRPLYCGGTGFYLKALTHGLFEGPAANLELREQLVKRAEESGSEQLHADLLVVDERAAKRIHPNDERRIIRALEVWEQTGRTLSDWQREWRDESELRSAGVERRLLGLQLETDELDRRIVERTGQMLDAGWVEEARAIRDGVGYGPTSFSALGYQEVLAFADGELTRDELESLIALRTRQFARKQRTWYRSYPDIHWIPAPIAGGSELENAVETARKLFDW
ncbi:MAG: tRNA dimethylallyltransferase [Planctomycetota bacterium]